MDFSLSTSRREQLIDITGSVQRALAETGLRDGIVMVCCPHTTAAITINENADPDVVRDLLHGLEQLAPRDAGYHHREGNSDGHIKSSLVGCSVTVPVVDGRLALGTWQGIYFAEFDGPRTRRVVVTAIPGLG